MVKIFSRFRRDRLAFFRQVRENYDTIGAIAPSSRFFARTQVKPLAKLKARTDRPVRVLEVGPGTGAVTRQIVRLLDPGDTFDLVEINPVFVNLLEGLFINDPEFSRLCDASTVHAIPLQEFTAENPYDIIVSGLPMNNFSPELVEELFEVYFRLLHPEGSLSYYEYMYVRQMRKLVSSRAARGRVNAVSKIMKRHCRQRRTRTSWDFANLPPAWVQHLSGTPKTSVS